MWNFFAISIRAVMRALVISLLFTATLGTQRAAAQPEGDARWVVTTTDGSIYRAVRYQDLGDAGVRVMLRDGFELTLPRALLAQIVTDAQAAGLQADQLMRTACPQRLAGPRTREFGFGDEPVFQAFFVGITPGRAVRLQRPGTEAVEERPWSELEQIRRPPSLDDQCLIEAPAASSSPPLSPPLSLPLPLLPTPDPNRGLGMLVSGGILVATGVGTLGGGVGVIVHSRAEEERCKMPGQNCGLQLHNLATWIGIGVTAFGGLVALVGTGLLSGGMQARRKNSESRYHALRFTPLMARSGAGLATEIRF